MKLTKAQAIERVYNNCNLIGEDVDVYEQIYKYKVLQSLSNEEIDNIYNYIVERMALIN